MILIKQNVTINKLNITTKNISIYGGTKNNVNLHANNCESCLTNINNY